jgi:aspartate/methionine/tyrosine aminotransferase
MQIAEMFSKLTRPAQTEPDSGIVNVAMYGMGRPGLIAFWSGEGNLPTPEAFCRPVIDSLLKGETFYTWQRGIPELRQALADYHTRHYGRSFDAENFFVTGGGMQAIQNAIQMVAGDADDVHHPHTLPGPTTQDHCACRAPVPVEVPMNFANGAPGRSISTGSLPPRHRRTRAILINSPSNPLGWTASKADLIGDPRLSPAGMASGSSPTRFTAASISARTAPPAPRPSSTSATRKSSSSSATPFPRTGP